MQIAHESVSTTRRTLIKAAAFAVAGGAVAASLPVRPAMADGSSGRLGALLERGKIDAQVLPEDVLAQAEQPEQPEPAANPYKERLCALFDEEGVVYSDVDSDSYSLRVGYYGDNLEEIDILVHFDDDGDPYVHLMSWSIGHVDDARYDQALRVCNDMNMQFYWAKFYVDSDNDVVLNADCIVDEATCADEVRELIDRCALIIDEAYLSFADIAS